MSELKAYIAPTADGTGLADYYLKFEADKVIAEKDREIALLKERICNGDVNRLTWIDDCIDKDKEIAELKAKVDELSFDKKLLDSHWESEKIRCESASRDCIELSNENAKLMSKIESLKVGHRQGIANIKSYYKAKLESVQASMYCDVVDANMENRRLKRALWLARAERYKMREFIAREEGNLCNQMSWSRILRERTYEQWVDQLLRIANLANKLQNKCLKKAEEYR